MTRSSGSACARRRAAAVPRGRRGAAFWGPTSMRMRCAWRSPTASTPASPIGCTWRSALSARSCAPGATAGLIVANPPYGERIGAESGLPALYSELGRHAARSVPRMAGRDSHGQSAAGAKSGDLCQAHPSVFQRHHRMPPAALRIERGQRAAAGRGGARGLVEPAGRPDVRQSIAQESAAPGPLGRARAGIDCFRVYDADMPEYAFAIDLYGRAARHVYVQEYAAPKTVDQESARERRREALAVLPEVLAVPISQVHSRVRKPQKGSEQYEKRDTQAERHAVQEGGLKFWVNFRDYLDTGLVSRPPHRARHAARVGEGRGFSEFILLHRQRHGVCRGGRGAQHRQRRSVEHLFGLGARESAAQRLRRPQARVVSRGLPAVARGAGSPGARGSI